MTRPQPAGGATLLRRTAPAAALALAVCIAAVGPVRLSPAMLVLLLAAAALLLAAGTGLSLPRAPDAPEAPEAPAAGRRALLVALVGSLVGGVLLLAALRRFAASESVSRGGWELYLLALVAAGSSFCLSRGAPATRKERVAAWELGAFLAVLAVGAAFRLHELRTLPYGVWFDEAENTLVARRILQEPDYRPVFVADASQMPALTFYVFAPFVKAFPDRALGVRVATTAAGLLALVATWLLGRELFGSVAGLLASGFLAVSHWHVGFSRFGVAHVLTTLVAPLVLFLLLGSQRRKSPRGAVLAGLTLGLGIQLYYSTIALPAIMAVWFIGRWLSREKRLLAAAGLLLLTIASAAFAYAPLLQFAHRHPEQFGERFRATVVLQVASYGELARLLVKPSPERRQAIEVLRESLVRHAKMFHYAGDVNGRHNLPLAPMLEVSTGVLFGIGLILCLLNLRDPRALLLLLAFGAFLAAGVLSVDFEAPQAARTLGLLPFACLMAALPLASIWEALGSSHAVALRRGLSALAIGLVGWAGVDSWRMFFREMPFDNGAFAAWSTQETKIADVIAAEGAGAALFVPPPMVGSPTIRLIARPPRTEPFLSGRDLPLETGGRRAIVFVTDDDPGASELLARLYPRATFEAFGPPAARGRPPGEPILTIVRISAASVEELHGWTTTLVGPSGEEASRSSESFWDWSRAPFRPPFTAHVRGRLLVGRDGPYTLVLAGGEKATLRIDLGTLVAPGMPREFVVSLARGMHDLALDVPVSRPSAMSLKWAFSGAEPAPIPSAAMVSPRFAFGGLLGSYHHGLDASGPPAFRRIDPSVAFYFHELPVDRPFSVRWTGTLLAPEEGDYAFSTKSIDGSTVALDGRAIVRNPGALAHSEGIVRLGVGPHAIEVTLQNRSDYAQIFLSWVRPDGKREIVPAEVLRPPPLAPCPAGQLPPHPKSD